MLKIGTKVKNIRLVEGDHNIDCKIDGLADETEIRVRERTDLPCHLAVLAPRLPGYLSGLPAQYCANFELHLTSISYLKR